MASAAHPAWIAPVPNALTFLRLALAIALPFLPRSLWLAAVLVAAATDMLDGAIARRFHAASELGRLLDGVADKAFAVSAVVTLTVHDAIAPWQGPLVLARDLAVGAIAVWVALTHGRRGFHHMQVRGPGKLTTLLAFAWFATVLVAAPPVARSVTFALAAATSLYAAVDYVVQARTRART